MVSEVLFVAELNGRDFAGAIRFLRKKTTKRETPVRSISPRIRSGLE